MGAALARLPGAFELMPQELLRLPRAECERRLRIEGEQVPEGLGSLVRSIWRAMRRYVLVFLCPQR